MLVDASSLDLVYQRATKDQITQSFEKHGQLWSVPHALREYLHMHHILSLSEASTDDCAHWALFSRKDPKTIISSCTTLMRDVIINTGQGSRSAKAVVITHIYTHPEHRMKGMATRLLKGVQESIDKEPGNDVEFSVVYSGVDTDFFSRLGWKPQPATQLRITLGNVRMDGPIEARGLSLLDFETLQAMTRDDVTIAKRRLSAKRDVRPHVQFIPSKKLARWHVLRSKIYSRHLAKTKPKPDVYGAVYRDVEARSSAWAWWVHDFAQRRLCVARMVATRFVGMEDAVKLVLLAAVAEAAAWGFREVTLWDPEAQVVSGAKDLAAELGQGVEATTEERAGQIPCLRWKGDKEKEVVWEQRQFYSWC